MVSNGLSSVSDHSASLSRTQARSPTRESTSEWPMVCGRVACCCAYAARWHQKSRVSSAHWRSVAVSPSIVSPGEPSAKAVWIPRTCAGNLPARTVVTLPPSRRRGLRTCGSRACPSVPPGSRGPSGFPAASVLEDRHAALAHEPLAAGRGPHRVGHSESPIRSPTPTVTTAYRPPVHADADAVRSCRCRRREVLQLSQAASRLRQKDQVSS